MAVGLSDNFHFLPIRGVRLAACSAAIYQKPRSDLAIIACDQGSIAAAAFTRNDFCAAPVVVAKEHIAKSQPSYLLINAGNANAGTGDKGISNARLVCKKLALLGGCREEAVLPFSTGVIGEPLPVDKICNMLPQLLPALSDHKWLEVARAIMTTDTVAKGISRQITIEGQVITITGIVKGSGMIRPDMATMLAFIATDAALDPGILRWILKEAVEESFNRVSVDGDTSTNDACVLIATGKAGTGGKISGPGVDTFRATIKEVCVYLAQATVRDGEGATKFVTLEIGGGKSQQECRIVAYAIAHSPLVKTAFYASDPNWGRILAAIGRAGITGLDVNSVSIYIDDIPLFAQGERAQNYSEAAGRAVFIKPEIKLHIDLGRGLEKYVFWTCDLSHEYVRINAGYRS